MISLGPFLYMGMTFACFKHCGNLPCVIDWLNRIDKGVANCILLVLIRDTGISFSLDFLFFNLLHLAS